MAYAQDSGRITGFGGCRCLCRKEENGGGEDGVGEAQTPGPVQLHLVSALANAAPNNNSTFGQEHIGLAMTPPCAKRLNIYLWLMNRTC